MLNMYNIKVQHICEHIYVECIQPKIVEGFSCFSFPPRYDSLQNVEVALLTVPMVVICEPVV